jgi:hypothetical protein
MKVFFLCALATLTAAAQSNPPIQPAAGNNLANGMFGTTVLRTDEWKPPTSEVRWRVYSQKVVTGPGAYFRAFGSALGDQSANRPAEWGQGWDAYGKRAGNRFLTFTLQDSAEAGLSAAAGYEPRYVQCKCDGFLKRLGHAAKWNSVTYDNSGKTVFNWPKFVAAYGVGVLSTTYTPQTKWSAEGIRNGNAQLYFGVAFNLVKEYVPDLIRKVRKK